RPARELPRRHARGLASHGRSLPHRIGNVEYHIVPVSGVEVGPVRLPRRGSDLKRVAADLPLDRHVDVAETARYHRVLSHADIRLPMPGDSARCRVSGRADTSPQRGADLNSGLAFVRVPFIDDDEHRLIGSLATL